MFVTRFVLFVLAAGLVFGAAFAAPAAASGFVKRGASGHAYYWQSGC